ncbi:protein FAM222B isoform X2 [Anolis sagrei]
MMNPPPYAAPSTLSHHPQQAAAALARHQQQQQQQQHLHAQSMAHAVLQPQLPLPQHPGNHLLPQQQQQQQPPPPPPSLHGGGRKMSDADAPPNVTVSTSTIPLSMAATLQQSQPPDLSSIVHQINQFCQARAGSSATSVCEGQIANPSPISRNLLISASTRVSAHSLPGPMPSCGVNPTGGGEHPAVPLGRAGPPAAYQSEMKQAAQAAVAAAAWNHHQLAHLQQMCGGGSGETMIGPAGLMGKPPVAREQGFAGKAPGGYPLELCMGQPFNVKPPLEKPTPSPPVNGLPYANGHYFPPLWNNILPTPNSDSSGSQDLAMPFHGTAGPQAMECPAGPHYRAPPNGSGNNNNGGMPAMEYLSSGDFQHHPCLREPAPPPPGGMALGKAGRTTMNRAPGELADSRSLHIQHPGYR